jgi:hypothetical protein
MEAAPLTLFERLEKTQQEGLRRAAPRPLVRRAVKARLCDKLRKQSTPAGNSCRVHGYRLVNVGPLR